MTTREYYNQEAESVREEFTEHAATISHEIDATKPYFAKIVWAKPGTGIMSCTYILNHRWLCAMGDIGEAIYEWSQPISPSFLASCDWHYMFGKCQASPAGRKFQQWDREFAESWAREKHSEIAANEDPIPDWLASVLDAGGDKDEFEKAARECYDDTGDAEEAGEIHDAGMVPDRQYIAQYEGLQMALKQLGFGKESK